MYHDTPPQQQLQYLAPTPPSTTPSPGQPHQPQFHQGPQPSPASAAQYAAANANAPQFQMVFTGPPQFTQYAMQAPHPAQFQVVMPQQHAPQ